MEIIFELFGEFLFEVVLTLLGEIFSGVVGAGFSGLASWQPPPVVKAIFYLAAGCLLGWVSLLILPHAVARYPDTKLAILIGTPIACAIVMGFLSAWRRKRKPGGGEIFRVEAAVFGLLFATPMATARFIWAT
jgi:hypothetical protein